MYGFVGFVTITNRIFYFQVNSQCLSSQRRLRRSVLIPCTLFFEHQNETSWNKNKPPTTFWFLKLLWFCYFSAHQPGRGDHVSGEHAGWPSPKEAGHHKSQGATWVGAEDQVARRPSSHGGWFPDKTWRPQKELSGIAYEDETSEKLSVKCSIWGWMHLAPPFPFHIIIIWVERINGSRFCSLAMRSSLRVGVLGTGLDDTIVYKEVFCFVEGYAFFVFIINEEHFVLKSSL